MKQKRKKRGRNKKNERPLKETKRGPCRMLRAIPTSSISTGDRESIF